MRAAVVHGAGDLRVEERPDPEPGPGEVLVAMEWGGICGSDVAYVRHGRSGTAALRHPLVLGHEVAGHVASVGPGVDVPVGRAVTVHPGQVLDDDPLPDRLAGRPNLARCVSYFGSAALDPHTDGGFSEYRVVAADRLRVLPEGVSTELGALAEPLAVALHAVDRAGPLHGRRVLVNGAGPIGSLVVAAARHRGAHTVIAADPSPAARSVAGALGADRVIDLAGGEPLPDDVEIVYEASGAAAALGPVLRSCARGGTVVQVGNLSGEPITAVLGDLVTREISWVGSYRFANELDDALAALAAGLDVSAVVTHRFELDEVARAVATAADPDSGSSKVLLRLGGGR